MSDRSVPAGAWIQFQRRATPARVRLVCFPYGGGGASVFRLWHAGLPGDIEVCPVQLPGRENRFREAPYTSVSAAVTTIADMLAPYFGTPYGLFGHSLGAFLAFELARELDRRGAPPPVHVFVAGQAAPQLGHVFPPVYQLPDEAFIAAVCDRYDALPQAVLADPELLALVLPLLRADFTMNDTYIYVPGLPISSPMTCLGATDDPESTTEGLEGWRVHTRGPFQVLAFPGGHFFINTARLELLRIIADTLAPVGR